MPLGVTLAAQLGIIYPLSEFICSPTTPTLLEDLWVISPKDTVTSWPVSSTLASAIIVTASLTTSSIIEVEPFVPSKCKRDKVLASKLNSEVAGVYDVPPYLSTLDNLISSI